MINFWSWMFFSKHIMKGSIALILQALLLLGVARIFSKKAIISIKITTLLEILYTHFLFEKTQCKTQWMWILILHPETRHHLHPETRHHLHPETRRRMLNSHLDSWLLPKEVPQNHPNLLINAKTAGYSSRRSLESTQPPLTNAKPNAKKPFGQLVASQRGP